MGKPKSIYMIMKLPLPEKRNSECVYCGTEYNGVSFCPGCGGSVTTDMGQTESSIGLVYDSCASKMFNPNSPRFLEKMFGDFWRTVQRETLNSSD